MLSGAVRLVVAAIFALQVSATPRSVQMHSVLNKLHALWFRPVIRRLIAGRAQQRIPEETELLYCITEESRRLHVSDNFSSRQLKWAA